MSTSEFPPSSDPASASRRNFLQQAAGLAAGVSALAETPAAADSKPASSLLPAIKPGMLASINLVGYPGRSFHGVVQGIAWSVRSPAGQELELLPKVDPTLNWARLAQRIPLRIIMLDPPGSDAPYRMGMTAVATITGVPPDGKPLTLSGTSAAVLK